MIHGIEGDEPLKFKRKEPFYLKYLKYASLLAVLGGALMTLVVKKDFLLGGLMSVMSLGGMLVTAFAGPDSIVARVVMAVQNSPPKAIKS